MVCIHKSPPVEVIRSKDHIINRIRGFYSTVPYRNSRTDVSAEAAWATIRRLTGAPALGHRQCGPTAACPVCDTRGSAKESLEQHAVRCPAEGAPAYMHAGLITTLQKVLKEAGVPTSATLTEARGMRGGQVTTRPGDIVVLDYHAPRRHLLLDGVVTSVYRNTRQRETRDIPGFATKLVEDRKFYADKTSDRPVARIHGGYTHWYPLLWKMEGALGRMPKHSSGHLWSGPSAKGEGADHRCVTSPYLGNCSDRLFSPKQAGEALYS